VRSYKDAQPTFRANCRPSSTARLKGSVSFLRSALARLRAAIKSSSTVGSNPFLRRVVTKRSVVGYQRLDLCALGRLTIVRSLDIIDVLDQGHPVDNVLVEERGVTEVVGHHDGWIQRTEIEGCDRVAVIALLRLNDCCAFVLLLST
jgi:hypothetical protein